MKRNLTIDAVILAVYAIVSFPSLTGVGLHEWAGMGLFALFFVHCAVHIDWALDSVKRLHAKRSWACQGNLALDAAILAVLVVVVVSGLGISGTVLPTFGLFSTGYYVWNPLHAVAAKVLLALLLVHVVVHARWIVQMLRKEKGDGELG